ncbi:hypothetical protein KC207_12865 [Phycicoccus sp. BSK3Z-2]|uniref:Uncharacterized protein n=1 Tax=Phycicoccus avicenniae TaxID=2828860 RepID=A0A941D939_9MICO|nr:hypothetical protein [Phycicoccus avicenniae]MBR7744178.1 hypothetical protein [Phycicoccus avicenniae]
MIEESRLLAGEARDVLNLPGQIDPPLRERITRARRQGTSITVIPGDPEDDHQTLALRLLDRVLDEADSVGSVVVYLPQHATTRLSTTPELSVGGLRRVVGCLSEVSHTVENDGLSTTVVVHGIRRTLDAVAATRW